MAGMVIGIIFGYITVIWHAENFQYNGNLTKYISPSLPAVEENPSVQSNNASNNTPMLNVRQRRTDSTSAILTTDT